MRALAVLLLSASAVPLCAQPPSVTVTVDAVSADSLLEVTPLFVVRAVSGGGEPVQSVTLQVDDSPNFSSPLVELTGPGSVLSARPDRPLPHGAALYWRASARTASASFQSEVTGPIRGAAWVTLIDPNRPSGSFLSVQRPLFIWRPGLVANPPGPWRYDLEILNVQTRQTFRITGLADTTASAPVDLEFNTSYRWSIAAFAGATDSVKVESAGSFVILDERIPRTNLLYQNFPNPFPTQSSAHTCIWFDLSRDERVTLEVLDLRGNRVRTIVPSQGFGPLLSAGRYGRTEVNGTVGCDPRLEWDGLTNEGRVAHAGVYLLRFRAGSTESILKMLFRGR